MDRQSHFSPRALPWILALVLLAGFLLRLLPVFSESFWLDEVITANAVNMPFKAMIVNRLSNQHSPFYFILLYPWAHIFGNREVSLRIPSLLASMAALWVFWLLACRFFASRRQALLAVFLLAASTVAIHYAQEARMYALVMLFTLLSFYFFWRLQDESRAALWLAYGAATLANLYLSVTTLPFLIVQGLWVLARRRRMACFALSWTGIGLLYLPMAIFYSRISTLAVTNFVKPVGLQKVMRFFGVLWLYPFDSREMASLKWIAAVVTILLFISLAALVRLAWRSRRLWVAPAEDGTPAGILGIPDQEGKAFARGALLAALWFVLPLAMQIGYSILRQRVFGPPRYLLGIVPAYLLILAWGAGSFRTAALRRGAGAVLVLLFIIPLPVFFAQARRPDWRHAIAWIEQGARPRDILAGSKFLPKLYSFYRRDSRFRLRQLTEIRARVRSGSVFWLAVTDGELQGNPWIRDELMSRMRILRQRRFPRLTVYQVRAP